MRREDFPIGRQQLARPINQASGIKQGGIQNCPNQSNGRIKHFRHGRAAAVPFFSSSLSSP
jgi:hypothetical protein